MTELLPLSPEETTRVEALLAEGKRIAPGELSKYVVGGYIWSRQLTAEENALLHRYFLLRRVRMPEETP